MGTSLIVLTLGALVLDERITFFPFPFFFILLQLVGGAACYELRQLMASDERPIGWLSQVGVALILSSQWWKLLLPQPHDVMPILCLFAVLVLAACLCELALYKEPGHSVNRLARTVFLFAYLGLLPWFLVVLRFPRGANDEIRPTTVALALAIFVPKCCDIGAYFIGRMLGRHSMAPVLSPKKTWEGAIGGLLAAALVALAVNSLSPVIGGPWWVAAEVGLVLGGAGILGDLLESLIKRDCARKDASQIVPGFGGVLDVIDAILFAAPIAYWTLRA
jgi:phosphatidate cytidylyltransferase